MKNALFTTALICSLATSSAFAKHHSGSVDKARQTAQGTFTRHVEQTATENGFNRTTTSTRADGKTATRQESVEYNKETETRTKTLSGTNFNGGSYSGQTVTQKTDTGFTRDSTKTNAQGKTASLHVDATVDKAAGTVSKNITTTKPNGETSTVTVVKTRTDNQH